MVKRRSRKRYDAAFKAKVALAAVRGDKTISELASHFAMHGNLVSQWKRKMLANIEQVFTESDDGQREDQRGVAGRPVPADRAAEGRAGVAQKKAAQFDG